MSDKKSLLVYPVGSRVRIGNGDDVEGTIRSIQIEANDCVSYAIVWWSGRDRKDNWIPAHEIEPSDKSMRPIGFHQ
jgi:hypothetical protein